MGEYNLKISDINWTEGAKYTTKDGTLFYIENGTLQSEGKTVASCYTLRSIANMRFRQEDDLSKVPMDFKVLVRDSMEYKVWEVFEILMNTKGLRRFMRKSDGLILTNRGNQVIWESGHYPFGADDVFIELKIDFKDAMKLYKNGHSVFSVLNKEIKIYSFRHWLGGKLLSECGSSVTVDEILKGKWYYKED